MSISITFTQKSHNREAMLPPKLQLINYLVLAHSKKSNKTEKKSINLRPIVVIRGLQTALHWAKHCLIGLEIGNLSCIVQSGVAQLVLLVDDPLDLTPD